MLNEFFPKMSSLSLAVVFLLPWHSAQVKKNSEVADFVMQSTSALKFYRLLYKQVNPFENPDLLKNKNQFLITLIVTLREVFSVPTPGSIPCLQNECTSRINEQKRNHVILIRHTS